MDKITLSNVLSGFSLNKINDNFTKIQDTINDLVLGNNGDVLQGDLDVNGKRIYNLPAPVEDTHPARLKDVTNAIAGLAGQTANLINYEAQYGIPSTNVQGAVEYVMGRITDLAVNAKQFGAKGDGVTNDTAALQAMFDTGLNWFMPDTPNGYSVDDTLVIKSDGVCKGFLKAAAGFNKAVVTFADPGYGSTRIVSSLEVRYTSVRQAGSIGIQIDFPSIVLDRCRVVGMDIGIQVRSYSIMLLNCVSQLNNTNLSAYAPSSIREINDLKVIGGNYDSAIQYAARIGDPRFSTTVAAGNPHGVNILIDGTNFDGSLVTVDRVFAFKMRSYHEGTGTGNAIELGGSGNNNLRNITIGGGSYFSSYDYAIVLKNNVMGLVVEPNYYAVNYCALYAINCESRGFIYKSGSGNGFNGPEVHTGFGFPAVTGLTFSDVSIEYDYLKGGGQLAPATNYTSNWYPNGRTLDGRLHVSSAYGRFRTNPSTALPGTQSGTAFTFTNLSDACKFNGGDRVSGANGASFVRYVDYVNGIAYVDTSGSGASTLSHAGAALFSFQGSASAAPTTGTYRQGDVVYNTAPSAGGYAGWVCTVAGSPGTWKQFGAIAS